MQERTANKRYKTYAELWVPKVCAVKFSLQDGTKILMFTRTRFIAKRWAQLWRTMLDILS